MESMMNAEPQRPVFIQMQQSTDGNWDVNQVGLDHPLASFSDIEKCVDYASEMVQQKNGIVVQYFNEPSKQYL
jgi:hypothetical protein